MATGGVLTAGSKSTAVQFETRVVREVVDAAAVHGLSVAAHCHGTQGISNAVMGGVRTIEHCSFAGPEGFGTNLVAAVVERIREERVWVSPTVNAGWGKRIEKDSRPSPFFERMSNCLGALVSAGVPLIASTDAGIPGVAHHGFPQALSTFARYADLSPIDALRAATSVSAEALGIASETGTLEVGKSADILVVDGDPTRDLSALIRARFVMARGEPIRDVLTAPGI
jgi:imidazolonepropionase-like amidohydrolase